MKRKAITTKSNLISVGYNQHRKALLAESDKLNAYLRTNPHDSKALARLSEVTSQLYR